MSQCSTWVVRLLGVAALLALTAGTPSAQEKLTQKHDTASLNESLREVLKVGVDLFNNQGDYVGCFRLYHGALLSVKPFLSPELQKTVDEGIAKTNSMAVSSDKAFELRRVIDEIRTKTRVAPKIDDKKKEEKKKEEKKVDDKKKEEKKKEEKKIDDKKKADGKAEVSGRIMFSGKALASGFEVTLAGAGGKSFSTVVQKDGTFQFKTPVPPGTYRVTVGTLPGQAPKGLAVPARYSSADTSGLMILVAPGRQMVDLNLVN